LLPAQDSIWPAILLSASEAASPNRFTAHPGSIAAPVATVAACRKPRLFILPLRSLFASYVTLANEFVVERHPRNYSLINPCGGVLASLIVRSIWSHMRESLASRPPMPDSGLLPKSSSFRMPVTHSSKRVGIYESRCFWADLLCRALASCAARFISAISVFRRATCAGSEATFRASVAILSSSVKVLSFFISQ
jgi:hypothetical protein